MNPRYPLYIVSKGRWESRLTAKELLRTRVPFRIIIEAQEVEQYAAVIPREHLLVLDPAFQRDYDPCDEHGHSKSMGSGPARNFAWEHSRSLGAERHWVMDDNIRHFFRLHKNQKINFGDGTGFRIMEDFVDRYTNVGMAGPQYGMFAPRKSKVPPFVMNTRIYSCNLILNSLPFRWRGRLNEDTILSLDLLKAGWCTVLFNAVLQNKISTQLMKGGNTSEFYAREGTQAKSRMLKELHPDVTRLVWRFHRHHHHVDYRRFQRGPTALRLVRKPGVTLDTPNEYGLKLIERVDREAADA